MLILLSPAKALDYETPAVTPAFTQPLFLPQAQTLIDTLRPKSPVEIAKLMDLSDKLALLNVERYQRWSPPFTPNNAKQAALAFNGDVYGGLNAPRLNEDALNWLQSHLRILSGLYGVLRPLDLIQPYRLEMGTQLQTHAGPDLYSYWRKSISAHLASELDSKSERVVINAASTEYSRAVDFKALKARVITPIFKDWKNGQYKIISFYAKHARGLFTQFAATSGFNRIDQLKAFDGQGYAYDANQSTNDNWVFLRKGQMA